MDNKHLDNSTRWTVLEMFIQAGYNIHKETWTPPSHSSAKSAKMQAKVTSGSSNTVTLDSVDARTKMTDEEAMMRWIEQKKEMLPRLMCLCRTRIRKRLSYCNKGKSVVTVLNKLPFPAILRNFVGFVGDGIIDKNTMTGSGSALNKTGSTVEETQVENNLLDTGATVAKSEENVTPSDTTLKLLENSVQTDSKTNVCEAGASMSASDKTVSVTDFTEDDPSSPESISLE